MCENYRVHPHPGTGPDYMSRKYQVYKISRVTLKFDHGRQFKNYKGGATIPDLPTKYIDTHVQRKRGKWRYSPNQAMNKVNILT